MKYLVELNYETQELWSDNEHFNFMSMLFASIIRLQEIIVPYNADNGRVYYFKYTSEKSLDDMMKEIKGLLYPFKQSAIAFRITAIPTEKYSFNDISLQGIVGSQLYAPFNKDYFIDDTHNTYPNARTDFYYNLQYDNEISETIHENSSRGSI